jgi:hypothetical protein
VWSGAFLGIQSALPSSDMTIIVLKCNVTANRMNQMVWWLVAAMAAIWQGFLNDWSTSLQMTFIFDSRGKLLRYDARLLYVG